MLRAQILALRHQLLALRRSNGRHRPRLSFADRLLWVGSQLSGGWRSAPIIVKPETVIAWHRRGFRRYWSWKSRHPLGRPSVSAEVITLIRRTSQANTVGERHAFMGNARTSCRARMRRLSEPFRHPGGADSSDSRGRGLAPSLRTYRHLNKITILHGNPSFAYSLLSLNSQRARSAELHMDHS